MTRKIQFRGKRTDNNEWVYGYYYFNDADQTHRIISSTVAMQYGHQIDPETLGQFTGKIDFHEKDIYEGDLIKLTTDSHGKLGHCKNEWVVQVKYHDQSTAYLLRCIKRDELAWVFNDTDWNNFPFKKEITGNIHDNK